MGRFTSNVATVLRFSGACYLTLGISPVKSALPMSNYIAKLLVVPIFHTNLPLVYLFENITS